MNPFHHPGVLEQLLDLRERCRLVLVRGNHEVMMLDALDDPALRDFWLINGGLQTLTSYGGRTEQVDAAHRALLSQCVPHFETERYLLVHANYMPHLPMSEQPDRVRLWQHLTTHTPGPHESGKTAIVGHTPQFDGDILDLGHVICLDTCCFGGGYLTAMELDSRQLWQADVHGRMRGA